MLYRQVDDGLGIWAEERTRQSEKHLRAAFRHPPKCCSKIIRLALESYRNDFEPERLGPALSRAELVGRDGIPLHAQSLRLRERLSQHFHLLFGQLSRQQHHASDAPAWPRKTFHIPMCDRIEIDSSDDDRNPCARRGLQCGL